MKIFIWKRVKQCSDHYHSEGGVVVFAGCEQRARELANAEPDVAIREDENPDIICKVVHGDEFVLTFPDKGCC